MKINTDEVLSDNVYTSEYKNRKIQYYIKRTNIKIISYINVTLLYYNNIIIICMI